MIVSVFPFFKLNTFLSLSQFCEFVSVSWLVHLVGGVVRMLLDYVSYVRLCPNLQTILETTPEWPEICGILGKALYFS